MIFTFFHNDNTHIYITLFRKPYFFPVIHEIFLMHNMHVILHIKRYLRLVSSAPLVTKHLLRFKFLFLHIHEVLIFLIKLIDQYGNENYK